MIAVPCDTTILCGISVRFQTLSPSERQVTHALLTRPPLDLKSIIRRILIENPVRLACVRRAASVRPEPGSNSLINFYQIKPIPQFGLITSLITYSVQYYSFELNQGRFISQVRLFLTSLYIV